MTPNNDTPSMTPEIHGRIFSPKEMLAIAVLGTIAFSGAANYYNGEDGKPRLPAVDVSWSDPDFVQGVLGEGDLDPAKQVSAIGSKGSETTVASTSQQTEHQVISETMGEVWARQFAQDEQAGRLIDPQEIDRFAGSVLAELRDGWTIDRIAIRGTTSAEDDSVNAAGERTAGLQITTATAAEKQEDLGDARRESGAFQLAIALQEGSKRHLDIDPSVVERLPSIEDILNDDEKEQVESLTTRFGYDNVTDMIERWNRDPDAAPEAVDLALTEILAKERTFQVEVGMSRTTQDEDQVTDNVPGTDIPGHNEIIEGSAPLEDGSDHLVRILPIVIPGYFFITMGRRRSRPDGSSKSAPKALPGAGPLPGVPGSTIAITETPEGPVTVITQPVKPRPTTPERPRVPRPTPDRFRGTEKKDAAFRDKTKLPRGYQKALERIKQPREHNDHKNSNARSAIPRGRNARTRRGR